MLFSVKSALHSPGKSLTFQFSMDLSDLDFNGLRPVNEPVTAEGSVRNTAGMLELSLRVRTVLDCICDRCAKQFRKEKEVFYECVLAEEKQDETNEDIVLLESGEFVDLEELARTVFVLEMDTKTLCSEDCKGLCTRCGADLNLGPCSCKKEADPRLAVLAKLLENSDQE